MLFRWIAVLFGALVLGLTGCQTGPQLSARQIAIRQQSMNLSGLQPARIVDDLRVSWAVPDDWESVAHKSTAVYTHQQWRSPSTYTGVGVVHIQLPFPIPVDTVAWLAKRVYLKRQAGAGKLLDEWTDSRNRRWFEAENDKYHVRGYAMTSGTHAWIVYTGWRTVSGPLPGELSVAERSVQSILPARNRD